jgi:DNA polymerase-3 subunit epsilon
MAGLNPKSAGHFRYAVVDIETSGNLRHPEKITEIAICVYDGNQLLETFHSLVNPQKPIDPWVRKITGITDLMVANEPTFEELHSEIFRLTSGLVFTAHNASFDYRIISQEFAAIGITFHRQQLCTFKAASHFLPGLEKYGLENLCLKLAITNTAPHRAMGDALATVEVLRHIIQNDANCELGKFIVSETKPRKKK